MDDSSNYYNIFNKGIDTIKRLINVQNELVNEGYYDFSIKIMLNIPENINQF